jgi:hypothetical protein
MAGAALFWSRIAIEADRRSHTEHMVFKETGSSSRGRSSSSGATSQMTISTKRLAAATSWPGVFQKRYGIARDAADRQIDEWLAREDDYWTRV